MGCVPLLSGSGAAYLIIGLMSEAPEVKAYLIEPGEVKRVEIRVVH